jgi:nucleoid-associated protein YgaU
MSSLRVHLRLAEDHSSLPFHPSCPVCRRDRLAGSLAGDELVSRRTQAAIAVGLLAFSAGAAPAAVAAGPDEEVEGSAEVVETSDPGTVELGEATVPLTDAGTAPPEPDAPADVVDLDDPGIDGASVEEAATEADEPLAGAQAEASEPVAEQAPVPEPVAVTAPPADAPTMTEAPEPEVAVGPSVDREREPKRQRESRDEQARRLAPVVQQQVAAPAPAPVQSTTQAPAPTTVRVVAGTSTTTSAGRASAGDRFHVVRRGESLWSIAADLLGDRATVPRIAREVNRLWGLNEDRIASGDPDLLYAGTRLRLR